MPPSDFHIELEGDQRIVGDHFDGRTPGYLFLHGLGSTRHGEKSDSLMRWAAERGRAFTRCDFRGHGDSTGAIGQVTISELIADTVLLLERVGPVIVIASSMGGLVGAFATARRPELVTALCLIAPAFGFMHRLERSVDAQGRMSTTDGRSFTLAAEVIADAHSLDERTLAPQLDLPTLIVHGDQDEVVPDRRSRRFFTGIPHERKELWIVEGGDHRLNAITESIWPRVDALLG